MDEREEEADEDEFVTSPVSSDEGDTGGGGGGGECHGEKSMDQRFADVEEVPPAPDAPLMPLPRTSQMESSDAAVAGASDRVRRTGSRHAPGSTGESWESQSGTHRWHSRNKRGSGRILASVARPLSPRSQDRL
jgi:hypothetical protein